MYDNSREILILVLLDLYVLWFAGKCAVGLVFIAYIHKRK